MEAFQFYFFNFSMFNYIAGIELNYDEILAMVFLYQRVPLTCL